MLISAKVNQWTLLVGSLPIVYATSVGGLEPMPLDLRQAEEVLLTAAQSNFAVILLAVLYLTPRGAIVLFGLFITQLVLPQQEIRLVFSGIYVFATALVLAIDGRRRRAALSLPYRAFQEGFTLRGHDQTYEGTPSESGKGQ